MIGPASVFADSADANERIVALSAEYAILCESLYGAVDEWLRAGWKTWVGREPVDSDFVFPASDGRSRRFHDADVFRADLESSRLLDQGAPVGALIGQS